MVVLAPSQLAPSPALTASTCADSEDIHDLLVKKTHQDFFLNQERWQWWWDNYGDSFEFKPGKVYWKVYVIVRKFLIAFAGLMFRGNVTFMLAFVCLTLIIRYVLQARVCCCRCCGLHGPRKEVFLSEL